MSEDFDKEAEREKLREKYEQDKQKRQATEQMSELLLQGATMTNAHCSECGDPIFRYEGQEFCPTCEKPVDRGDRGEDAEGDEDDGIQVTTPSNDARVSFGQDGAASEPTDDNEQSAPTQAEQADRQPATAADQSPNGAQSRVEQGRQHAEPPQPTGEPQPSAQPTGDEASVAAAREALVGTLTRFSQQAAAADDPNRAKEHLAAAREAAEALSALGQ